ncbi:MAG: thiamine phosphate synthase [Flavobacteriales bacterium]|nr:thiamine phosphate synthase [Flavobacteriales bacterium]
MKEISKIQYVSPSYERSEELAELDSLVNAGLDWIQLRIKHKSIDFIRDIGYIIKSKFEDSDITLIMNDHAELAKELDFDGVHLGKSDMPVLEARNILGPKKIIGGTANTFKDISLLIEADVDYIGLGPYRFTTTKENLSEILGIKGYEKTMQNLKQRYNKWPPIIAIGGIELKDIPLLKQTEIHGIAVSNLLANAIDKPSQFMNISDELNVKTTC